MINNQLALNLIHIALQRCAKGGVPAAQSVCRPHSRCAGRARRLIQKSGESARGLALADQGIFDT